MWGVSIYICTYITYSCLSVCLYYGVTVRTYVHTLAIGLSSCNQALDAVLEDRPSGFTHSCNSHQDLQSQADV